MQMVCASRFFLFCQIRKYEKLSTRGRPERNPPPRAATRSRPRSSTSGRE